MALFYFDVFRNDEESKDAFGTECENLMQAGVLAQQLVIGLAQDEGSDRNNKDIVCVVRCADHVVRFKTLLSLRSEWEEFSDYETDRLTGAAHRLMR